MVSLLLKLSSCKVSKSIYSIYFCIQKFFRLFNQCRDDIFVEEIDLYISFKKSMFLSDQIEIINAQQTCRNRCVLYLTESSVSVPSDNGSLGPEKCLCTIDCAERSICCPDYAEYCVLGNCLIFYA